jgi:protein SCO1
VAGLAQFDQTHQIQTMKIIRYGAWALVVLVFAALAYVWLSQHYGRPLGEVAGARIGGPFTLVSDDGETVTDKDLFGKPHAVFFGFTHCPEVYPTTLYEARGWMEKLGGDADNFAVYFITVDPERDTQQAIAQYMSLFDDRITGLTGSREQIGAAMQAYKVYAKKVPLGDGDYTMDHTATVYLMDAKGEFAGTISWGEDPDAALAKVRKLIENG